MQLFKRRQSSLGPNTATHVYQGGIPLHIVRGQGCHLYCSDGTEYLDCVNNVAHVGHCHPEVAQAVSQQLITLNTNVRYLHSSVVDFAEALVSTLPQQLQVCYYVNSGSECNDLALRIARLARPGATHVAVMAGAYHGHVSSLIDLSPFKFNGQGGGGQPAYVHVLPCPDTYRGLNLDGKAAARAAIEGAHAAGGKLCAFFCESILSCGGQVVLPKGYLQDVYREMRAEGALCVADEVQCGYGRAGSNFWVFETQDVAPDILTTGKPIGNGFPMSVLVTSRELAKSFSNGMEYFNTFGGCTAAGAAGLATFQVLRRERLQENAAAVGAHLLHRLSMLQKEHACLGDVRGMGLMQGIEIVTDPTSKRPDSKLAAELREQMAVRHHVLVAIEGPHNNIVKIKPPLCFSHKDADRLVDALSDVLASGKANGGC
ncbi:hypothetical protein WJX73_009487 [Symbiochloris irregularis]|uniref:Uncharacterized protein n=1 Tax=Symbiochloris irregularis TaxID=706552 RepID=A0AAW1NUV5_9CHLO